MPYYFLPHNSICCHFIVDYIVGDLFKCKNKPNEMASISVSSYFKVTFESASFHSLLGSRLTVLHNGGLQSKDAIQFY